MACRAARTPSVSVANAGARELCYQRRGRGGGVRQVIYDRVYRIVDRQEGRSVGRSIK